MAQTFCKLTSKDLTTHGGYIWRPYEWHAIPEEDRGGRLCSSAYFHFYRHPLQAAFFNCVHAAIEDPSLREIEVRGEICHEFDKSGATEMRVLGELPLPVITQVQRVAIAILFVAGVYKEARWNEWADRWLSAEDRWGTAATRAVRAAADGADVAAQAGADGAEWAARAAEWAARAARAADGAEWATQAVLAAQAAQAADGAEWATQQDELLDIINRVVADPRFGA